MDQRFRPAGRRAWATATGDHGTHGALGLAHDFRNMLQLASSAARLVRREIAARHEYDLAAMMDDALDALERANLLGQRLSGPEASQGEVQDILLQRLVPDLRSLLSRALGDRITFESLVAEDLPPLRCDRLQLENVLVNLALNSREAMPHGGTLLIEALRCLHGNHRRCIVLSVSDTGGGMAPDIAAKAFEPFFSTRLLDGGNGLGLYNVHAFAQALGGSALLFSKENEGTRVQLHLPVADRTVGRRY